jgi:glycosyltransferase involved in cell wall biosynthesis
MKVTALVSGYYAEDFIETRLINLRSQECETVLICQAGSAEEEVGRQYGVKLVTTPDVPTLYAAWNMGIRAASGDFLVVANTDDLFYDNALRNMARDLDESGADILYTDYDIKDGKTIQRQTRGGFHERDLCRRCFIGPMPMWRRSLHERYGYFDESFTIAGDWEFWLRCVVGGARLHYMAEVVGRYWRRDASLEHRDKKMHTVEKKIIKDMYS